MPLQAQGEFALVKEELEGALNLPGQPVKRGTMAHKHIIFMMLTDSAAQLRDRVTLGFYAAKLEELALRDDHRPYLAVAHRAWGIANQLDGDFDEAEIRLKNALSLFEELNTTWQIGRTRTYLAELALARADQNDARDYFASALEAFETLGAKPDVERTRRALEAVA